MSVLIVVAHPDDEVLGCGGTISVLTAAGEKVYPCFLSGAAEARQHRPELDQLHDDARAAARLLGMQEPIFGPFANIRFNVVPTLEMVQYIESVILKTSAQTIFTHHPSDLNDDHLHTSRACQAASRFFQRRPEVPPLKALHLMEVPSSTEWRFASQGQGFEPNSFFEIGEAGLQKKIAALAAYRGVMRPFPHPRCEEVLRGLAAFRGGQSGMKYAEAFQTVFQQL